MYSTLHDLYEDTETYDESWRYAHGDEMSEEELMQAEEERLEEEYDRNYRG